MQSYSWQIRSGGMNAKKNNRKKTWRSYWIKGGRGDMSALNEMVIYLLIKSIQCLPGLKVVSSSGQPFSVTFPSLASLGKSEKVDDE